MKTKKKNKGVFTVELTLIFPVIFLSILAVMYMSIIHYQNIATAAVAMQSANRIAAYWQYIGDGSTDMLNGTRGESAAQLLIESDFKHRDPYRNIIDGNRGNRERAAQDYANSLIRALPSFYSDGRDAELKVEVQSSPHRDGKGGALQAVKGASFLFPYIEVSAERKYINPLGRAFAQFGVGERESRTIRATAPLTTNAEFIRNIDFIQEMVDKYK